MSGPDKKPYVQFSKRIVVAVTASVTALCLVALLLCFLSGGAEEVVMVVKIAYNKVRNLGWQGWKSH